MVFWAIKKPRTFSGGASLRDDATVNYVRTTPEPREGLPVFVVVFVVIIGAGP
jgi:hypothetical protein